MTYPASCGAASGIAGYIVNGGVSPYTFIFAGRTFSESRSEFGVLQVRTGTYPWSITDNNGCSASGHIYVPENGINVTVRASPESCNGVGDGSVNFTTTGGSGSYQYMISGVANWTRQNVFTNLLPGLYKFSAQDGKGCFWNSSLIIAPGPSLAISAQSASTSCYAQATGGASLSIRGGTLPYVVYIDSANAGSSSNGAFSALGLSGGLHAVVVKDPNSCIGMLNISVPSYPALSQQVVQKHDMCGADDFGSVTLAASGGIGKGYQFSVDGKSSDPATVYDKLSVGQHFVSVIDDAGCSSSNSMFSIAQLPPFTVSFSAPLPWCKGGYTNLTISASGASNNFTYTVNGTLYEKNVISVQAGTDALIVVSDANGCGPMRNTTYIDDLTVFDLDTVSGASGCSDATGTLQVTSMTGGTAPYLYSFDGQNFTTQTFYPALTGGDYIFHVQDAHNCPYSEKVTVNSLGAFVASAKVTNPLCNNSTGSISVTATGGLTPYFYYINGNISPSSKFERLAAGTYSIDVKDSASPSCFYHISVKIVAPPPLTVAYTTSNPTCSGSGDGVVTLFPSGGSGNYTFSVYSTSSESPVFSGLSAGNSHFTVSDANGCQAFLGVQLTDPEKIFISATIVPTSYCASIGALILNATGGAGGYEFGLEQRGVYSTNNTIASLGATQISVVARDSNMCPGSALFNISTYPRVAGNVTVDINCDDTGRATFNAFNYDLSELLFSLDGVNYNTSNVFEELAADRQYTIYVSVYGCADTFPFSFASYPDIVASAAEINATCFGWNNGAIQISASGGLENFTYSINDAPASNSPIFSGLYPGSYKFTVNDSRCTYSGYVTIYDHSPILTDAHQEYLGCTEINTGAILVSGSGGTAPYYYSLDGKNYYSSPNFTELASGTYTYYVKDSLNCSASSTITLIQNFPQAEVISVPQSCDSMGSVTFIPLNSSASYSYSLGGNDYTMNSTFGGMSCGNHRWKIKDDTGCVSSGLITVDQFASGCDNLTTCSLTPSGPTCSDCPSGYNGTGISGCTDIDECANSTMNNCTVLEDCVNFNGSYTCRLIVVLPGKTCAVNNGGCAYNVKCTLLSAGVISCGACPAGMTGNGSVCTSLCGNGKCDANETCITCPLDCPSPCGLCGDGECSKTKGENCTTCYDDCGACRTCAGGCSPNGQCENGQCVCSGSWSGPSCQDSNQDLDLQVDPSSASLSFASSTSNSSLKIKLSVFSISEYSPSSAIPLRTFYIEDVKFDYTAGEADGNGEFLLGAVLDNGAKLNISVWLIKKQKVIEFANISTTFLPNSVKLGIYVANWPFMDVDNYLGIVTNSQNLEDASLTQVIANVDERGNLKWIKYLINGFAFYGQFQDKAVLDGYIRTIKFTRNVTDNSITTIIPHFWDYADIDPNFAVLLDSNSKSDKPNAPKKGGGVSLMIIAFPSAVGAILVGTIFVCFAGPRIKEWWQVQQAHRNAGYIAKHNVALTDSTMSASTSRNSVDLSECSTGSDGPQI